MIFIIIIFIILGIYLILDKYVDNNTKLFESFESKIYINEDTNNDKCENCDDCDIIFEKDDSNNNNNMLNIQKDISSIPSKDISIISKCFSREKISNI